jgi:hypothetical protein
MTTAVEVPTGDHAEHEATLRSMLCPGQIVKMDNLTAHKGERVKELIEERGCELLYLPPYSLEFNPIEEAFAKIKGILRKAGPRTREALIEAIGQGSLPSLLGTPVASSSTADTMQRFNHFDCRCRHFGE